MQNELFLWYGYIYKTINLLNGKVYIGQKKGPFKKNYKGSGLLITRAIKLHGKGNFETKIISYAADKKELDNLEIAQIQAHRNSLPNDMIYNIMPGGQGGNFPGISGPGPLNGMYGKKHSEATKEKIRQSRIGKPSWNKGKHLSQESKNKMIKTKKIRYVKEKHPMFGKHLSIEHRERLRLVASQRIGNKNAFYGKKHSPESLKKMSESHKKVK